MKQMQTFSGVIEGAFTSVLEAAEEIKKDGAFTIKSLSVQLSFEIEQKFSYKSGVTTQVSAKSNTLSENINAKNKKFSSQLTLIVVPKIPAF